MDNSSNSSVLVLKSMKRMEASDHCRKEGTILLRYTEQLSNNNYRQKIGEVANEFMLCICTHLVEQLGSAIPSIVGLSFSTILGVNALLTKFRSRVWSGASRNSIIFCISCITGAMRSENTGSSSGAVTRLASRMKRLYLQNGFYFFVTCHKPS